MENSKLLVPVILSIMNHYKKQATEVSYKLKQVEYALSLVPTKDVLT